MSCTARPGWFTPAPKAPAVRCPIGTFKPEVGNATSCTTCGKWLTNNGIGGSSSSACLAQPGWYIDAADGEATECEEGTYRDRVANSTSCSSCADGLTTATTGNTNAVACEADVGYFIMGGSGEVVECPAGTWKGSIGNATSCTACEVGLITTGTGSTGMQDCEAQPGWYVPTADGPAVPCPGGSYHEGIGNGTSCTTCAAGLTTSVDGAGYASACVAAAGYYIEAGVAEVCPLGTFKGAAGNSSSCTSCGTGLTTTITGADSITACVAAAGYYVSSDAVLACTIGTFKTTAGNASACDSCGIGTTTLSIGSTSSSSCLAAPGWFVSSDGAVFGDLSGSPGILAKCPLGTYKPSAANASECTQCPLGSNTLAKGAQSPIECVASAGFTVDVATGAFEQCAVGSYKAAAGNGSCSSCGCSLTTAAAGATAQSTCVAVAGWFVSASGTPEPCPLSTFKGAVGNSSCISCPTNTVTITLGATSAAGCIPTAGFYLDSGSVLPCPPGTFKATEGAAVCTPCPANRNTTGAGATSLSACLAVAGYYVESTGVVTVCPVGTYKEATANTSSCIACGTGASTASAASTSASACQAAAGHFTPVAGGAVQPCPVGTFAEGAGFRTSCTACGADFNTIAVASTTILACLANPGYYTPILGELAVPCPLDTFKETLANSTTCSGCSKQTITLAIGSTDRKDW